MSYHPALLRGLAQYLHAEGIGEYSESGAIPHNARGIILHAYPETPAELVALFLYLPGEQKLSPTAASALASPRVQIKYRLAGHPFKGIEMFDRLHDLIDRQNLTLGEVRAIGKYESYAALGQAVNGSFEFSTNWTFTGLRTL